MNTDSQWSNKKLVLHVRLRCGSLSITTPVSLLANEFNVRRVLHGQVSLAAVNQTYVIHEAMKGCKKSKDSLTACFDNVNINISKLTHLSRMEFPNLNNWTSPFLFFGLLGGILSLFSNFKRTYCNQTVQTLIRRHILWCLIWFCNVCPVSLRKDTRLTCIWSNVRYFPESNLGLIISPFPNF